MTEKVARAHNASKKKMQEAAKRQTHPDRAPGPRFRNSPGGRRLEALRKKKQAESD